jgi:hypothetical protein
MMFTFHAGNRICRAAALSATRFRPEHLFAVSLGQKNANAKKSIASMTPPFQEQTREKLTEFQKMLTRIEEMSCNG